MSITPLLVAAPATAEAPTGLSGTVVAGAGMFPEYEGSDSQRLLPLVNGRVSLGERYLAIEGVAMRANVVAHPSLEAGPVAHLTFGRNSSVDSVAVGLLPSRSAALELGGFVGWRIPVREDDTLRFAIEAAQDVTAVHRGWIAQASVGYTAVLGPRWLLSAEASATFADDDYAATYFSITPQDSLRSGLATFEAEGGLKDVGLTLGVRYAIDRRWSLNALAGYSRLLNDFADSPVVSQEGSADQFVFGAGIGFSF